MKINSENLSIKDLSKRINWKLQANFFTLEQARELSFWKLKKVIKLIAKIEGIKLTRQEIRDLVIFIQSDFKEIKEASVAKLFDFIVNYIKLDEEEKQLQINSEDQIDHTSYQDGKFELMRN